MGGTSVKTEKGLRSFLKRWGHSENSSLPLGVRLYIKRSRRRNHWQNTHRLLRPSGVFSRVHLLAEKDNCGNFVKCLEKWKTGVAGWDAEVATFFSPAAEMLRGLTHRLHLGLCSYRRFSVKTFIMCCPHLQRWYTLGLYVVLWRPLVTYSGSAEGCRIQKGCIRRFEQIQLDCQKTKKQHQSGNAF